MKLTRKTRDALQAAWPVLAMESEAARVRSEGGKGALAKRERERSAQLDRAAGYLAHRIRQFDAMQARRVQARMAALETCADCDQPGRVDDNGQCGKCVFGKRVLHTLTGIELARNCGDIERIPVLAGSPGWGGNTPRT